MSAEQNRNTDQQQRQLEDLQQQLRRQRPTVRPVWRSLRLWPVLIVLVGLLWWGFWGGGWFWNRAHEGGNNVRPTANNQLRNPYKNQPATVTKQNDNQSAAMLNSPNKQQYIGQSLEIVRTPVLQRVSDSMFWLGAKDDPSPVLVVMAGRAQNAKNVNVQEGETMNVVGQVQKAPTVQQATQGWHLSHSAAERLQYEGAYIEASEVEPLQK